MTKRVKKIICTSFLMVFLLGYIGTFIPGSVLASLFDVKVYAEGEEEEEGPTISTVDSVSLNNALITESISSLENIPFDWTDGASFEEAAEYEVIAIAWENQNHEPIDDTTSLETSTKLYGIIDLDARYDDVDDIQYQFNMEMTQDDVEFNGYPVYSMELLSETSMQIVIEVDVEASGETIDVETILVGSATLSYLAGEEPQFTARSLESSLYTVDYEGFIDTEDDYVLYSKEQMNSMQNLIDTFVGGKSYSYIIRVVPANPNVNLGTVTSFVLNGVTYELEMFTEEANSGYDDEGVLFWGYPTLEIAGGGQTQTLSINVLNNNGYNNGDFAFDNGSAYINVNGNKFTEALTNGNIVVNGTQANIEVVVSPNAGYTAEVSINGMPQNSALITENTLVDIIFSEEEPEVKYTLVFETFGGTNYPPLSVIDGSVVDLSIYNPEKNDFKFVGWYTENTFDNKVTSITMDSYKTVYAKYESLKGEVTVTYNSPLGLDGIAVGDSTLTASGNSVVAYISSEKTNTIKAFPMFMEGYTITLLKVTDADNNEYTAGPGEKNEELSIVVPGSTSYSVLVTLEKLEEPNQTYHVTYNLPGVVASNTPEEIDDSEDFVTTLSLDPELELTEGVVGYHLPYAVVIMVGATPLMNEDNYSYNPETGVLTIPRLLINDNISITAPALSLIEKPSATVTEFTYDGLEHSLELTGYFEELMNINGNASEVQAGEYSVTFELEDVTYIWSDNDENSTYTLDWKINQAEIHPTVTMESWKVGSEPSQPVVSGNLGKGTETFEYKVKGAADSTYTLEKPNTPGNYIVKVTIGETRNYKGGAAVNEFSITADKVVVDLPMIETKKYVYTGEEITASFIYQSEYVNIENYKATEIGNYKATLSLKDDSYEWADGTKGNFEFDWSIVPGIPEVTPSFTYNSNILTMEVVPGATGYQVFGCNSKGESCKQLSKSTALVYTRTKLDFNKANYYKVRSYTTKDSKTYYSDYTDLIKITTALNAPVVKASNNRYQEVKLSWKKESGAEMYYVYTCDEDGNSCVKLGTTKSNSYVDKTAKASVSTYYKVKAYKAKKYSAYSNLAEGLRLDDKLTLTVLNNGYLSNTINVKYLDGATKYIIEKSTDNKKFTSLKTFVVDDETEITDEGMTVVDNKKLSFNKKVYYRVRAYNGVNYTAYYSKTVTVKYLSAPEVEATSNRYQEVKLSWDKQSGAEMYYVYTCDEDGNSCVKLGTTKSNSYVDKTAKEGVNTYYKVKTYKAKKYSAYSNLAIGVRLNDDLVVSVDNTDYLTNTITIENKLGATKYQIQSSLDNKKWTTVETIDATGEDIVYEHTNLKYNKKYYYRVRAYNDVNYTAFVKKNVTTTKLKTPEVAVSANDMTVILEITKVPQAGGYEIYHSTDGETWTKVKTTSSLTFSKDWEEGTHYFKVRAYKKVDKSTFYSDFNELEPVML